MSDATDSDWALLGAETPNNVTRDALLKYLLTQSREAKAWRREHETMHANMHTENTVALRELKDLVVANTAITQRASEVTDEIREYWSFGKVGTKVMKWAGVVGAAIAGVAGAWWATIGHGSGGIGPTP